MPEEAMTTQPQTVMPLEEVIKRLRNGPVDTVVERAALHHLEAHQKLERDLESRSQEADLRT